MASCHQTPGGRVGVVQPNKPATGQKSAPGGRTGSQSGSGAGQQNQPSPVKNIILAGNPNCGKSALFNQLTGLYVNVSNFPGTTVDVSRGMWLGAVLTDTPGVYGLGSYSDEERIARDAVFTADVVVNVVNATTLERDLFLTLQLVDAGVPLVVALNMMDEAERLHLRINKQALERAIGVPVVPIVAVTGQGLTELVKAVQAPRRGLASAQVQAAIREIVAARGAQRPSQLAPAQQSIKPAECLLIAEGDAEVAERYSLRPLELRAQLYTQRRQRADRLAADVVTGGKRGGFAALLGEWAARPIVGLPFLVVILAALYWLVGVVVAQTVVGFTEGTIMQGLYEPVIRRVAVALAGQNTVLYRVLAGEFGVFTMTVTYAAGLLLPLVAGFYLSLAILEDSGYLPRVAVLADRALTRIGLNGRAVIPMILGFGCVTMATLTTRVLGSRRERTIASALLGIAIPCSAQLAVTTALVTPLGLRATVIYCCVLFLLYGLVGSALNRVLPGESTDLIIDLPPLRLPRAANVLKKTAARVSNFLLEATPIFAAGALGVAVLQETGILLSIQSALAPITTGWLQLPAEASRAFVMGLVRRDFGAAGLYDLVMTPEQKVVAVVTITLFVPCIASMLVLMKERGWREGTSIFLGGITVSIITGGLLSRLLHYLPSLI